MIPHFRDQTSLKVEYQWCSLLPGEQAADQGAFVQMRVHDVEFSPEAVANRRSEKRGVKRYLAPVRSHPYLVAVTLKRIPLYLNIRYVVPRRVCEYRARVPASLEGANFLQDADVAPVVAEE